MNGSIIVIYNEIDYMNSIKYSVDYGNSFRELNLNDKISSSFKIINLEKDIDDRATHIFLLIKDNKKYKIVSIDFGEFFDNECKEDDMEF